MCITSIYLDNAATTPLSQKVKERLISLLDNFYNPSSTYQSGQEVGKIISDAREAVAKFINADSKNIYFTPSGSGSNTLAIKGMTSENPEENQYEVFYSPTSHKSMLKACESCIHHTALGVNQIGKIDLTYLDNILTRHNRWRPLVCIEAANSEIGTINDIISIGLVVHKHNGILIVDATGYIPYQQVDIRLWHEYVDILTFSGHKLHALKGIGVLWKRKGIALKPLIFGSQEQGLIGGTSNVLGIASLGESVKNYNYSSISSDNRDYVYEYIMKNIPDSCLIGASIESGNRLPQNLYICFKGIEGESLMILLDMNGIQVSTGSACNSGNLSASATLSAIGIDEKNIHSCIRLTFSGRETTEELDYVNENLKYCVESLRKNKYIITLATNTTKNNIKQIKNQINNLVLFYFMGGIYMATIIGSARIDENGKISGGIAGDQKQTSSANDTVGEVSMQNFYVHTKGWYVIRPKDAAVANKIAENMRTACNNANIGYDQSNRLGVVTYGVNTKTKTECDCSSLVRECVKEASGKDPGNFTTANEKPSLKQQGCLNPLSHIRQTVYFIQEIY